MFERIISFLHEMTGGPAEGAPVDEVRVAAVALCRQVMAADGRILPEEAEVISHLMRDRYGLDDKGMELLAKAGERAEKEAVDYFRFTSILKRALDENQRIEFIGILWDIVYADGVRSEVEDHVIWRIADLLGIEGRDRVEQRIRAEARLRNSTVQRED